MSSAKKQSFFGRGCFSRKLFGLLRYSATMPERIWKVKTPLYGHLRKTADFIPTEFCGAKRTIQDKTVFAENDSRFGIKNTD